MLLIGSGESTMCFKILPLFTFASMALARLVPHSDRYKSRNVIDGGYGFENHNQAYPIDYYATQHGPYKNPNYFRFTDTSEFTKTALNTTVLDNNYLVLDYDTRFKSNLDNLPHTSHFVPVAPPNAHTKNNINTVTMLPPTVKPQPPPPPPPPQLPMMIGIPPQNPSMMKQMQMAMSVSEPPSYAKMVLIFFLNIILTKSIILGIWLFLSIFFGITQHLIVRPAKYLIHTMLKMTVDYLLDL